MNIYNFNPYHDEKGRFCSSSEAKIKSLEKAFQKVKAGSNEEIVKNIRDDLEQYGGTNDVALIKGNSKGGVEHIDEKHHEDLSGIFKALVDGEITQTVPKRKVFIEHNGYRAVLSLDMFGNAKTWLLTGYKIKETSVENSEVCTHSAPMQFKPTFSRQELGADVSNKNITDNTLFFNPNVTENNDLYVSRYDRLKAGEGYFRIK